MPVSLSTCSYREYRPDMGVAIRTSRSHPRFFRHRPLFAWHAVMPERAWLTLPRDEYTPLYLVKLDQYGAEQIAADLNDMVDQYRAETGRQAKRLVLMCFESLVEPESWCHRTLLAGWLTRRLGQQVEELGATAEVRP